MDNIKQEYVICNECESLVTHKPSYGTNSLSKHIRSCVSMKPTSSSTQATINQFYKSSKEKPAIPNRIKQEIIAACTEFTVPDCRPFKTVNGIGFKNLAQKIFNAGRCLPMSRQINMKTLIPHSTTVKKTLFQSIITLRRLCRSFFLGQPTC